MQTIIGALQFTALDELPWLAAVWFCFLGGCIGSFLNVVAYRMPLGMSLLSPGSHCPVCEHRIRARDNIPVWGWILLKGRCRDCKAPIPGRYPTIEAVAAAAFGIFWWVDIYQRRDWVDSSTIRFALFALHALLSSTVLAIALIDFDGKRTPSRIVIPCCLVWVWVYWTLPEVIFLMNSGPIWSHPFVGAAVGIVFGGLVEPEKQGDYRWNRFIALTLVGTFLSVVSVSVTVVAALLGALAIQRTRPVQKHPWFLSCVFAMTVLWAVINSGQINAQHIGEQTQIAIVLVTAFVLLIGFLRRRFWMAGNQTS